MSTVYKNKRAYYDFEIVEELEAGISLTGAEIKSLRHGRGSLQGAFVSIRNDEAWIKSWQIPRWEFAHAAIDEQRDRRLLMHRKQIDKWHHKVEAQGLTIVPLRGYFNKKGKFKIMIGLARGKKQHDKRNVIKDRESDRKLAAKLKKVY